MSMLLCTALKMQNHTLHHRLKEQALFKDVRWRAASGNLVNSNFDENYMGLQAVSNGPKDAYMMSRGVGQQPFLTIEAKADLELDWFLSHVDRRKSLPTYTVTARTCMHT